MAVCNARAQIVTTVAGTGTASFGGDGSAATSAYLYGPITLTNDASGNLYIADATNNRIRKVTLSTGVISTIAGNGTAGYSGDGGSALSAELNNPSGVALDASDNVYICDYFNSRIRKVTISTGVITTVAGTGTAGFSGDGGAATAAEINEPSRILVDASGNIYIGDRYNYRVRKVTASTGVISTIAGNGSASFSGDGGAATSAGINVPYGMVLDGSGNLYIADLYDSRVRMVNTSGIISTFAGTGSTTFSGDGGPASSAGVPGAEGLAIDSYGNIYIGDNTTGYGDDRIRKVTPSGIISTFAGTGGVGYSGDGGLATAATFDFPGGLCYDVTRNYLYIADQFNNRIRRIALTNHPPHFTDHPSTTITVCENSSSNSINSVLSVLDTDAGQTELWSVTTSPVNGSLSGFTTTYTSTGGTVTPAGLGYTPTTGYSGSDSFGISVSDGLASDTITIYVTINPLPDAGTITGTSSICAGTTTGYSDGISGGTWTSGSTAIATVTSAGGVVSGVAAGSTYITYSVTNSCGTSWVASSLTVLGRPDAGSISGVSALCATAASTFTDAATGGVWSLTNSNANVSTSGTVTGVTAGLDTLVYTVTTTCGVAAAKFDITINVMPAALTGSTAVCVGSVISVGETVSGGTWSSSSTGLATVDGSGNVTGVSAGTLNISYIITSTGCGVGEGITVNPLPSSIGGPSSVCQASTITLTNTASGGSWVSNNTTIATVASASGTSATLTGVSNGTDVVTYTLATGCRVTKNITVNALPNAISGATSVCVGSNITLADASGGGGWSSSASGEATVDASGTVGGVSSGSPTITYTLVGGCYTTSTITVNALPNPISGGSTVCTGNTASLSDIGGGSWASSNTTLATVDGSGVVYGIVAGTLTITYTLATSCQATLPFTVNQSPSAISGATSVCEGGSTATVIDMESGGTWTSSNTSAATITGTGLVTGVAAGTTTISYVISGCPAMATFTVNPKPGAIISPIGDTMLCPGDMAMLTANTGRSYTYQWYNGATSLSGETEEFYEATTGGGYIVQVTNGFGCLSTSVPMAVSINPAVATVTSTGGTTFCAGLSGTLNANTGVGLTYQWLLDGGGIAGATGATYNPMASGDYDVIVSNIAGCSATSTSVAYTVIAAPVNTLTYSRSLSFCTGDSVVITGISGTGLTYQWMQGGSPIAGATNVSYTATTTGTYQLMETNSYPCSSTSPVASVNEIALPSAAVTATGPTAFCVGGGVTLDAAAGAGGTAYQWYMNGIAITGAVGRTYNASATGNYSVREIAPTGCVNTTYPAFPVMEVTTPSIIPYTATRFCWGGSALLGVDVSTTGAAYQWQTGATNIPGATNITYDASVSGNYSCIVTLGGGCTVASVITSVTELPLPDPIISYDGTTLSTGSYYVLYQWFRNMIPVSGGSTATLQPDATGEYTVRVIDTNGCQSVSSVYIVRTVGDSRSLGTANVTVGEISIYPNPATDIVHIISTAPVKAVITAIDGRKIMQQADAKEVNIGQLSEGMYMILLYDADGNMVKAEKLLKK